MSRQHRLKVWHYFAGMGIALILAAPPALVSVMFQAQSHRIDTLEAARTRQGNTLAAHGLPRDGQPGLSGKPGANGQTGQQGPPGRDGIDGISIRGPQGQPGGDGKDGKDGTDGKDGSDGVNGTDSTVPGPPGPPGQDSTVPGPKGDTGPQGPQGEAGPAPKGIWIPDGMGGRCLAADDDGDGVYECPPSNPVGV